MRKYILNSSIIGAVIGGFSAVQTTRKGPRDWRLILMWVSWGLTVAIAAGTIVKEAQTQNELED